MRLPCFLTLLLATAAAWSTEPANPALSNPVIAADVAQLQADCATLKKDQAALADALKVLKQDRETLAADYRAHRTEAVAADLKKVGADEAAAKAAADRVGKDQKAIDADKKKLYDDYTYWMAHQPKA